MAAIEEMFSAIGCFMPCSQNTAIFPQQSVKDHAMDSWQCWLNLFVCATVTLDGLTHILLSAHRAHLEGEKACVLWTIS